MDREEFTGGFLEEQPATLQALDALPRLENGLVVNLELMFYRARASSSLDPWIVLLGPSV